MKTYLPLSGTVALAHLLLGTLDPELLTSQFLDYLCATLEAGAAALIEKSSPAESRRGEPVFAVVAEQGWYSSFVSHVKPAELFAELEGSADHCRGIKLGSGYVAACQLDQAQQQGMSLLVAIASERARPIQADELEELSESCALFAQALHNSELYESTRSCLENIAGEAADRGDKLEQQRALTDKVIDSLPLGLYVVDRDYRIVAWNRNRELGAFGIKRSDAVGKTIFEVLRRYHRGRIQAELDSVFESGAIDRIETSTEIENETRNFLVTKIPMRLHDAEVTHVITLAEDTTERTRIVERAAASEKLAAIGQLAAGVVHEINNPLATIAVCAEALAGKLAQSRETLEKSASEFAEYLSMIESESYRCKAITNSLLDFSRAQSSAKELIDLNRTIDQTLFLLKHHNRFKTMRVSVEHAPDLPPVLANDGQIKQALMAILINAADSMEDGGRLTVRSSLTTGKKSAAVIDLTDTGCGIPAESLSKIFDPFFTTKPRGTGTGLGLSVTYGIIAEHGGRVLVDSKAGEGTHFQILLPISKEAVREACFE